MVKQSETTYKDDPEKETIKFIDQKLFASAKTWKYCYAGSKHATWIDDIKWYKGMQWSENRSRDKSSIFFNRLFSVIQKELPIMTDRPPKIYVSPEEPDDKVPAKIIQRIIENKWLENNMDIKIPEAVLHAKQCGTGFLRPFWNPLLAGGLGDVDCEVIDPLEVFPLAYTKNLETGDGLIWARWVSLGYVKKTYAEGWLVKASAVTKGETDVPDRSKDTNRTLGDGYAQVTDTTGEQTYYLPSLGSQATLGGEDTKRVLLVTCLIRDGSTKDVEDEGKKKEKKTELLYPNGRQITYANNIILEDGPYAFEDTFPGFVDLKNYIQPSEFWGMSDITQIKEGQKELNKLQAMIIDSVKRTVYTPKFVMTQSGIDVDNFVVTADSIYETKMPNPVTELVPQALPSQIFAYSQQIEQAIANTAGSVEYNPPQGGDLPSGRALGEFNEISQTRLRQKLRNLAYAIRIVGKHWVSMILQNYTDQRIMRLFNSSTNQQEYVFVFREEDPAKAQQIKEQVKQEIVLGTEQKDPKTGQVIPGSGQPKYEYIMNMAEIKEGMDLTVADSSTVSTSRISAFDQSMALYQIGVIDDTALLESADYPNREELQKRMGQKKAQAQQAAQQQQQMLMQQQQQLEQAKMQVDMGKTQVDSKTTLVKTQEDNATKLEIAAMNKGDKRIAELENKMKNKEVRSNGG